MAWGDGLRPEDEDKKWSRASSTENDTANEKKEDEREYAYYKIPLANKNEIKQLKYLGFIVIICIAIYAAMPLFTAYQRQKLINDYMTQTMNLMSKEMERSQYDSNRLIERYQNSESRYKPNIISDGLTVKPEYPMASIRRRETGTVKMKITVMPDGSAYEVKLLSGSGYKSLDQAAITAAKQGSYKSGLWHDLQASVTFSID